MKRLSFVIIVLLGIMTSCTKNFEDFNTDKKRPVVVPAENLFANAQKALADQEASTNVNLNVFKLWAQYWTETTYTDEANYDIITRPIPDNDFQTYYRNILEDLKDAKAVLGATTVIGDIATAEKANKTAIIDCMQVYTFAQLLEIFGDIPYTQALDITNIYPKYDNALDVYKDLLVRLDADLAGMNDAYGSFGTADLYMGGDVAMWKKFANSMKVRIGITIADGDNATAKAAVESGYAGAFAPDDKCQLVYLDATNCNPLYADLVQSGRSDFIGANTFIDALNTLADPRRASYFTQFDGAYVGGPYGESNPFAQFSHVADAIEVPTFPSVLLDGTEIAFYLAEAAERGYTVGGTATSYYNAAITSSFNTWGVSADAAAYLAKPSVAYATATGNWKQKIGTQAWIAYYTRGQVAWTSWRRLDFPVLNLPPTITSNAEIPVRFTYPVKEQTLNKDNFTAAVTAMGGNTLTTKLFWDKY
ncbi:MAG: SusD/RagB family nutrient-binding outer membrane lipoprotein [Bacteroidota bacterium]